MEYGLRNDSEVVYYVVSFYNTEKTTLKIIRAYQEWELEKAKAHLEDCKKQSFYPHGIIRSEKTVKQSVVC